MNLQGLLLKSFSSERCDTELAEVMKNVQQGFGFFQGKKGQLLLLPETAESMGFGPSEFDVNDLINLLEVPSYLPQKNY